MQDNLARAVHEVAGQAMSKGVEAGENVLALTRSVTFQNYSACKPVLFFRKLIHHNRIVVSAFMLLVWDYIDTMGAEVKFIWV